MNWGGQLQPLYEELLKGWLRDVATVPDLASLGHKSENPIAADVLVVADRQWGRVNKGNPGRLPEPKTQFETQRGLRCSLQLPKKDVTDPTRKFSAQMLTYVLGLEHLEIVPK